MSVLSRLHGSGGSVVTLTLAVSLEFTPALISSGVSVTLPMSKPVMSTWMRHYHQQAEQVQPTMEAGKGCYVDKK